MTTSTFSVLFVLISAALGSVDVASSMTGACATNNGMAAHLRNWIERTSRDGSYYAQEMREVSGLPLAPTDSVRLVSSDSVCAALGVRFARGATARDTVNVAQVLVVAVGASKYVVTDVRVGNTTPQFWQNPDGTHQRSSEAQWMQVMLIDVVTDQASIFRWNFVENRPTPY